MRYKQVKESLIAFVVAFGLTVAFSFLALAGRTILTDSAVTNNVLILVEIGLFFAAFYFLANTCKIRVMKSTTLAVLLGVSLGSVTAVLLTFTYPIGLPLYIIIGSLVASVSQRFLPALTALLFAELREKKSNHNLKEENDGLNAT